MEKDYRSLEQKIKNIIIESANFRNTNSRIKVVNVARPDDVDPTSEKSKLAKQSEIKNKIIDEAKDKEVEKNADKNSKNGASAEKIEFTGGKTEVDTEPKTDDKINDESTEKKKGDKAATKANKEIGQKSNTVKEESSMFGTPKNFGLSASLITAVSEAMKVRKEADANLDKVNDIASNLKGMSTKQPGKLPNTDAGGPDMFKSNAPSIVKKEALHPNQKKLDVAPPKGKLTAADFAKLRKEEVEEGYIPPSRPKLTSSDSKTLEKTASLMKRENDKHFEKQTPKMQTAINLHLRKGKSYTDAVKSAKVHVKEEVEIEEGFVVRYNNPKSEKHGSEKHFDDQVAAKNHAARGNLIDKVGGKYTVHKTNEKGHDVKEEVEELDELSKSTLGSYIKKSAANMARQREKRVDKSTTHTGQDKAHKKELDRKYGIHQAVNKLTKEENIDELSKDTLGSYAAKAHKQGDMAARMSNGGQKKDMSAIANKRYQGVQTAIKKLRETEEIQFSEEEIARIEEIAKGL